MDNWSRPSLIQIPSFSDDLGKLGVIESSYPFPFEIKRVYFLHDIPSGAIIGSHAHKALYQLIVPISGSFEVNLDDGNSVQSFNLSSATTGLTVPPGYWRTLTGFTPGASALVIASEQYTPSDYIREYEDFLNWARNK